MLASGNFSFKYKLKFLVTVVCSFAPVSICIGVYVHQINHPYCRLERFLNVHEPKGEDIENFLTPFFITYVYFRLRSNLKVKNLKHLSLPEQGIPWWSSG